MTKIREPEDIYNIKKLSRDILIRYFGSISAYLLFFVAFFYFASFILKMRTWYPEETGYQIFKMIERNAFIIFAIIFFIGWFIITYYFITRLLNYLNYLSEASKQLVFNKEEEIKLPEVLKVFQRNLNDIRLQSIHNEKIALENKKRKDDMLMYLAHDLKTPLSSVIGYISLLRDIPGLESDMRRKYTGIALSKAERLEELINEFFDITRFSLDSIILKKETVDLSFMLEQMLYEYQPIMKGKDLSYDFKSEGNVLLLCDTNKIERLFDNLLKNAVSYSFEGSVIHVTIISLNTDVIVKIKNHCPTIAPEMISGLFNEFFRLDNSRSSKTGGSGLGLAIAREIVEAHGGSIDAESKNETLEFTIRFYSSRISQENSN